MISPERTAAEIMGCLVSHGAAHIALTYKDQRISGLQFAISVNGAVIPFSLPVRIDPVFKKLNGRRPKESWRRGNRAHWQAKDYEQAERVAWRQLLRWIEAQLAMIDTGMVEMLEVFMPYVQGRGGQTLFEEFRDSGLKLLGTAVLPDSVP